jgi:hypothetical protein
MTEIALRGLPNGTRPWGILSDHGLVESPRSRPASSTFIISSFSIDEAHRAFSLLGDEIDDLTVWDEWSETTSGQIFVAFEAAGQFHLTHVRPIDFFPNRGMLARRALKDDSYGRVRDTDDVAVFYERLSSILNRFTLSPVRISRSGHPARPQHLNQPMTALPEPVQQDDAPEADPPKATPELAAVKELPLLERLKEELDDRQWDFRTPEGLAEALGVDRRAVLSVLRADSKLVRWVPARDRRGRELLIAAWRPVSVREWLLRLRASLAFSTS